MPEVASFPERDRLLLELLYGCGIRNSELVGINLDDIRISNEAILIRGKGKEGALRPVRRVGREALLHYLPWRQQLLATLKKPTPALLVNQRGGRLTTRSVGRIVKRIAVAKGLSPTCTRTPSVTPSAPTCSKKEPTCAPFRNCSATSVSPPRSATRNSPSST